MGDRDPHWLGDPSPPSGLRVAQGGSPLLGHPSPASSSWLLQAKPAFLAGLSCSKLRFTTETVLAYADLPSCTSIYHTQLSGGAGVLSLLKEWEEGYTILKCLDLVEVRGDTFEIIFCTCITYQFWEAARLLGLD